MKKKWALALTAMVSAASLGIAAPASAQTCVGIGTLPPLSTVSVANGQIRIDPNGVPYDVRDAGEIAENEADEALDCVRDTVNSVVPPSIWCAYFATFDWLLWGGYVYTDDTGAIVIDYGRFVADADNAAACI